MTDPSESVFAESVGTSPLSAFTTMRVGGPAKRILIARETGELIAAARELWDDEDRTGEPWLLLGGGSNTVVSDDGFPGTVLLVRTEGVRVIEPEESRAQGAAASDDRIRLRIQAGHDWDAVVSYCVERGWSGIEALSGIPGLSGAAPVQNIGAYGQELSDVLHSIEFYDRYADTVLRLSADDLELGYRSSTIKSGREGVVLSIDLLLSPPSDPERPNAAFSAPIAYGQLADALGVTIGDRVSIRELRRSVLRLRASKGMVLDSEDHDTWSAGSFFTNPIVSERFARALPDSAPKFPLPGSDPEPAVTTLEELAAGEPLRLPEVSGPRLVKLSAAWLIEHAGISRGFRLPGSGAAISGKHTLAITNRGAASATDVAELARYVVHRVQSEFGVTLVPEPNLYGFEL